MTSGENRLRLPRWFYLAWLLVAVPVVLVPTSASGHQDGCHAQHSCPSDANPPTYTCGDTGHCSQCPDNQFCLAGQPLPSAPQCGVERWSVKTGTDPDAHLVNLASITPTTIQAMRSLAPPASLPENNRVAPVETTVYVLDATLTIYKQEDDFDYHLVVEDASGNTMITEIASPSCVGTGSPFAAGIALARSKFDSALTATGSFQTVNVPVRLTGVGFFDFLHGQTGVAPNGIELHPVLDIVFNPAAPPLPSTSLLPGFPADYDGDGKTDIAVYRPSTGTWYIINSAAFTVRAQQWGASGDIPVPGNYDGDGKDDITAYRPSNGTWFIIQSGNGAVRTQQWGASGDVPQPGDYDGDGKTDIAVYRPSTGVWFIINSSTGVVRSQQWGAPSDRPVPGDYDGDHRTDIAVYRPSTGTWYIINSATFTGTAQQWGAPGDIPVPGDYDGDGKTDIAVFRPSTGVWFIINSSTGAVRAQQWGAAGDVPVPGDYDGDGKTDIAVYRPSTGVWFIIRSSTGSVQQQQWGAAGDQPLPEWF